MQNDNQPNPNVAVNTDSSSPQPPTSSGGQKVIQPTPGLVEELKAQQESAQPAIVSSDIPQPSQPGVQQSVYPQPSTPASDQMQVGMSASQMGWSQSQSKSSDFNLKNVLIKGLFGLGVLGVVFAILVFTNIIALSKFKTIDYANSSGTHYSLQFYSKHTTKTLKSGNTSLVSKVSEGGKYPLTLSIASGSESGYARAKDCSGSGFTKVFDVQNNNLNQKISVCNFSLGQSASNGVYIAGILYNNQTSIVTISQDLSGVDLSSQSGAQQSLSKFGLDSYQDDIKKIVASIKVE